MAVGQNLPRRKMSQDAARHLFLNEPRELERAIQLRKNSRHPDDSTSISSNVVRRLFEDSRGWVGLFKYDPYIMQFYRHHPALEQIRAVSELSESVQSEHDDSV